MISTTVRPLEEYDIRFDNSCRVIVGGASPSFIITLKQAVNKDRDYVMKIAYYKKNYPSVYDLQSLQQNLSEVVDESIKPWLRRYDETGVPF
jgi:hypothetical protein